MLTMTKGDILELTNNAKRKAVLEAWNEWPVWADVPEIGLTVYKLDLPDGKAFTASWYAGDDFYPGGMAGNTNRPRFHLIGTGGQTGAWQPSRKCADRALAGAAEGAAT